MMALHPVLALSFALFLAVVLLTAASHKLTGPQRFAAQLADYDLLPSRAVGAVARVLPWAEILIASTLLVPALRAGAALCAFALLGVYTAAIAINLWRGRSDIDCGCGGPGMERPLNGALMLRNVGLLAIAVLAALPAASLPLHFFGLFLIASGTTTALIVYTAIEGLLANQSRLNALSGRSS